MRTTIRTFEKKELPGSLPVAWPVLLVLALFWAPGTALGGEPGPAAASTVPVQAQSAPTPSAAYPRETLFYLEITEPVEILNLLGRTACWTEARPLLDELAGAPRAWAPALSVLAGVLAAWDGTPELGFHLEALAGRRLAAGLIPMQGSTGWTPVCVMKGSGSRDRAASLEWIFGRARDTGILRFGSGPFQGCFWIHDRRGTTLLVGRELKDWLVISPPSGYRSMEAVAAALASGGLSTSAALSGNAEFQEVMSSLPASANARAFLNVPLLLERIHSFHMLSGMGKRCLKAGLAWNGALGIAREIDAGCIRTWVAGRILPEEIEAAVPGLLDSVRPVETTLVPFFPGTALAAYEVGVPAGTLFEMMGALLKEAAPRIHQEMMHRLTMFRSATGLDLKADFLPRLGPSLAVAWLPAEEGSAGWPLPRLATMMRIESPESVREFLHKLLRYKAGALAPFTGGIVSAMVVTDRHEGVEVAGLKCDSILSVPLPSPAFAIVDDLLIISPFRTAVKETISVIHGNAPGISGESLYRSGMVQPGAMELIHLNFTAWERDYDHWWDTGIAACSLLLLDRKFAASLQADREWLHRVGRKFFRFMGALGRATGSTVITLDGGFTFFCEVPIH